jgi:cyclophilin family peptidyl-prolyl cis-trans isomerase
VTKKQHDKEVARARVKRQTSRQQRRERRNRIIVLAMVVLMAFSLVGGALLSLSRDPTPTPAPDDPTEATSATQEQPTDDPVDEPTDGAQGEQAVGPCGPTPDDVPAITSATYDEPFALTIDPEVSYLATFETTCGDIVVELDAAASPVTVNNLVNLAEDGYYDGIVFHRVIEGFMAQVGDPTGTGGGGPGYTFEDELERAEAVFAEVQDQQREALGADAQDAAVPGGYPRGTVAMANAGPDTNGSQLFFSQGDPTLLPSPAYTVFGTVVEGMEVVDDIVASPTDPADRPLEDIAIRTVTIEQG